MIAEDDEFGWHADGGCQAEVLRRGGLHSRGPVLNAGETWLCSWLPRRGGWIYLEAAPRGLKARATRQSGRFATRSRCLSWVWGLREAEPAVATAGAEELLLADEGGGGIEEAAGGRWP